MISISRRQKARHARYGVGVALAIVLAVTGCARSSDESHRLMKVASRLRQRPFEPRIVGLPWLPPQSRTARKATYDAKIAAAEIIFGSNDATRRERAIAKLIGGDYTAALQELEADAARDPNNAVAWSDLAAARFVDARRRDDAEGYARALAAADRAIHIRRDLEEAHFNRACALEAMQVWKPAAVEYKFVARVALHAVRFRRETDQDAVSLLRREPRRLAVVTRCRVLLRNALRHHEGPRVLHQAAHLLGVDRRTR